MTDIAVIRALALGDMRMENARAVLLKEFLIGLLAGGSILTACASSGMTSRLG